MISKSNDRLLDILQLEVVYRDAVLSNEISDSNRFKGPSPSYGSQNDICSLDGGNDCLSCDG